MRSSVSAMVGAGEYGATRWIILAVVSAAQFLGTFDLWVVTIALPALQKEFAPASLPEVAWILNVYTIVLATLLAPAGRIADSVGRKTRVRRRPDAVRGCLAGLRAGDFPAGGHRLALSASAECRHRHADLLGTGIAGLPLA